MLPHTRVSARVRECRQLRHVMCRNRCCTACVTADGGPTAHRSAGCGMCNERSVSCGTRDLTTAVVLAYTDSFTQYGVVHAARLHLVDPGTAQDPQRQDHEVNSCIIRACASIEMGSYRYAVRLFQHCLTYRPG